MRTPLTIGGHLDRAALVYGDRTGLVDEPDPPGGGLGTVTYRRMRDLARAQAAALDERGLARGERVAILSQNAGRLLTSFFGVSGWGRVLVPINFRLSHDEIAYILEHSGASMLLVDAELADSVADLEVKHRLVLGTAPQHRRSAAARELDRERRAPGAGAEDDDRPQGPAQFAGPAPAACCAWRAACSCIERSNSASKLTCGSRNGGKPPLTTTSDTVWRMYGNSRFGANEPRMRFVSSGGKPRTTNTPACLTSAR